MCERRGGTRGRQKSFSLKDIAPIGGLAMKKRLIAVSATAVAALFLVATSVEQADAQRGGRGGGGRDGGPSAGPRSMGPSGGPRFEGRGPSAGPRFEGRGPSAAPRFEGRGPSAAPRFEGGARSAAPRFEGRGPSDRRFDGRGPPARSFSPDRSPTYGYMRRFDRRDARHRVRRFRGHRFIYGVVPFYGAYTYRPCAYYYQRARATGSYYWWDRYYACTGGDYYD